MATSQTSQITDLNDLPSFAGHARRPGEAKFKSDVDVRTFIRIVENYFLQHGIISDERKMQIVYSVVYKKKGTALNIVNCYVGKNYLINYLYEKI